MTVRFGLVAAALVLALTPPASALGSSAVQPSEGESVVGPIAFPRAQKMEIDVAAGDRLAVKLAFDGRCTGDGLGELWMSFIPVDRTLPVSRGTFSGKLTGSIKGVGGDPSRTAYFSWTLSGSFTSHGAARATASGTALVRRAGKVVSRCTISKPATAKLSSPAK
jgi:hypothetical protein